MCGVGNNKTLNTIQLQPSGLYMFDHVCTVVTGVSPFWPGATRQTAKYLICTVPGSLYMAILQVAFLALKRWKVRTPTMPQVRCAVWAKSSFSSSLHDFGKDICCSTILL